MIRSAFTPEEELLVLLNLGRIDPAEEERARALAAGVADWRRLEELAAANAATVLTARRLRALRLPQSVGFDEAAAREENKSRKRIGAAAGLLHALNDAGIEVIALKGAMAGACLYEVEAYKKMNDVDVLIRRADAEKAIAVLKAEGFISVGPLFGKKEISPKSHHAPPFVDEGLNCVIGLHWGLHSALAPWKTDVDGLWARKEPITLGGAPAFRLGWEDGLLHMCMHLPFYKTGLRELADVFNLALFADRPLRWDLFLQLARAARAMDPSYRVLRLAQSLRPFPVPIMDELKAGASAFTRRDTDARAETPASILRSRSVHIAKIEKAFVVFKVTGSYRERLKAWLGMWALTCYPPAEDLERIMGPRPLSTPGRRFAARLLAPRRVWRAMARDHGEGPLTAITAINAALMAWDTLLKPFRQDRGPSLKNHPARPLLEVLE